MKFQQAKLDNGLEIVAEVNEDAASMAAGFFVRTGSRDETPAISGVSHFLEHMVFKGTERRSAADVNREYDEMGALANAFTSEESTVYYAAVLPEFQHRMLDLLCDILRPALRQDDFDVEKGVIQEEIALYEDRPHFRLYDNLMTLHFAPHPLGNSILGTPKSIQDLQRDQMQGYFDRRYSPTNVTLAAVGNLDFDALVAQVTKSCSHWQPIETDRELQDSAGSRKRDLLLDANLARENVGWMSPAPSSQDPKRHATELLSTILGDTTGSRLYYELVETALADEAHTMYSSMDGAGALMTFASMSPDRMDDVCGAVRRVFEQFLAEGPTEAELRAAKNKSASGMTLKGEQPFGRLVSVGFDWVYRRAYEPLEQQIDDLFAVSAEDVLEVARSADLTNATMLALGPVETIPE